MATRKIKVKLLTSRVDGNESWIPGDVLEVDGDEAKRMFEAELAEPVAETRAKKATKAAAKPAETR